MHIKKYKLIRRHFFVKDIYFDHAATTKIDDEVLKVMLPYLTKSYGNPSSIYRLARENKKAIEKSRENMANIFNCSASEIYFTSGGSESDNWAVKSIAGAYKSKGRHIITSEIEHHAVLNSCKYLESQGFRISYLKVNKSGIIEPEELKKIVTDLNDDYECDTNEIENIDFVMVLKFLE